MDAAWPLYTFVLMKITTIPAKSRGYANHGWLETYHSFSFASWHDPQRIHFGSIRVLNDDKVEGGRGFARHHHDNMEIISIPLEGGLVHEDSMGNKHTIRAGDVQVMSAGTGIFHSEKNESSTDPVKFLQIWILPNQRDVTPRYQQISTDNQTRKGKWQLVVSPDRDGPEAWVHQKVWLSLGEFNKGDTTSYDLHNHENGIYLFVLEGEIEVFDTILQRRDAMEITEADELQIAVIENAFLLLIETTLNI